MSFAERLRLLLTFLAFLLPVLSAASVDLPQAAWPSDRSLGYEYSTKIKLSDHTEAGADGDALSAEFKAHLTITRVARLTDEGLLLELKVSEPRLGSQTLTGPSHHPVFLVWRRGSVELLYVQHDEPTFWTNICKGIASFVHSRTSSGEFREVDASGECLASYSLGENGATILRVKKRCSPLDLSGEVSSRDEFRQVRRARVSRTVLTFRDGLLEAGRATEAVTVGVDATGQKMAVAIEQTLQYKTYTQEPTKDEKAEETLEAAVKRVTVGKTMRAVGLTSEEEGPGPADEKALRKVIEEHREALRIDQAASTPAVAAFRIVLEVTRRVKDSRILHRVLTDDDMMDVMFVLADVYVACGTGACLTAALDWVSLKNDDRAEESERLLLGLSLLTDPDEATLKRLLKDARTMLIPKEGQEAVRNQLWATLGALTGRFSLTAAGRYAEVTSKTSNFLLARLREARSEDDVLAALNALANLRSSEPVSACLELLANATVSGRARCAAIDTIQALEVPPELRGSIRLRALRLFQSRPFFVDVTARLRGLDLLLHLHPTISQLVAAGRTVINDAHLRHAFLQRVKAWSVREDRHDAWEHLHRLVPNLIRYPGPSAQPPLLEETTFGPSTQFELSLITGNDGAVRRSDTKANLELPNGSLFPLYQLGIYTDGLGSVATAASGGEEGGAEEITAGLSMRMLGASLRPIRFFMGYSGLMAAVWNAPSSLTPFLQTNMAFLESSHLILLQNGLSVRFSVSGLASIDLSGLVSISMWNQQADTQLKTQAAIELSVGARLATDRFSMQLLHRGSSVAGIDFDTHVAFSSNPPTMCLLAIRPDTIVEMRKERQAQVQDSKPIGQARQRTYVSPGVTLSLGRANERACASLM